MYIVGVDDLRAMQSGKVDDSADNTYLREELRDDYCLSCVAYPRSDVTLETYKEDDVW